MRRNVLTVVLLACFIAGLFNTVSAQTYTRIRFAKGAVSKKVSGTLRGFGERKYFKIKVRAGQTLSFAQTGDSRGRRPITIFIKDPAGEDATDMDASCNNRKSISPTAAGDYTLEVIECQKADEWRGGFMFRITVR